MGDYKFVMIGLMVGSILPIICIICACYDCIAKGKSNVIETEMSTATHTIERLQSGTFDNDKNKIETIQEEEDEEDTNTIAIAASSSDNILSTPGQQQVIMMMGFVNDNEQIDAHKSSNIEMKSVLMKNMHTSPVSTNELINAQTTNTQQTTNESGGEEGINKYAKIENILKKIDEDEYEMYLSNFKKQKVDDDA